MIESAPSCSSSDDREERLAELKRKVHDDAYLNGAILRIAQIMSAEIIEGHGVQDGRRP